MVDKHPKPKSNKKELSRELTMKKLRKAGLVVFSKYGFDSATTKMVAQQAGINEALITRYFNGKAGLLEAVIKEFVQDIHNNYADYPEGTTLQEELKNFMTASTNAVNRNPKFLKLALSRAILDPKMRKTVDKELESPGDELLLRRLKKLQSDKKIPKNRNAEEILEILRLFCGGIFLDRFALSCSEGISVPDAIDHVSRAVARDLTAGADE